MTGPDYRQPSPNDVPHALYRFYSDSGQLLYVGITNDPPRRLGQHADTKTWWHDVAGMTVEWHPTRAAVLAAEKRAILVESPRYNVVHANQRRHRGRGTLPRTQPAMRLVWTCGACGQPIDDSAGYVHIDRAAVRLVEEAWMAYEQKERADDCATVDAFTVVDWHKLAALPADARWQTHHGDCDPDPDGADYWFGVERARTHAHLLDWTAHLMQKPWLRFTDWPEFIKRAARVDA